MTRLELIPALVFLALACGPALADPVSGDLFEMTIGELLELEVSAPTRAAAAVERSPTALTVYERDEIRAMGVRYLHELLAYVPGFQTSLDVTVAGQRHALSARGSVEFHSPGVLVLRDGRRVNDVYTRGAPLFARWISLERVVRVEVIRGPGSTLYGSNALVGVVNLVTDGLADRYALLEAGSNGERRAAVAWHESSGVLGIEVGAELLTDDGERRAVFDRFGRSASSADPRRFEDLDLRLTLGRTALSYHEQRRQLDDFYNLGGVVGNGLNRHEARQRSVSLVHELCEDGPVVSRVTAEYREADWDFVFLQAPAGTGPFQDGDFLLGGTLDQEILTLSYEGTSTPAAGHRLSFGAEYVRGELPRAQLQSTYDLADPSVWYGEVRVLPARFARDETTRNRGLYLEHTWDASDRFRSRVGLRLDDDRFTDAELSPRVSFELDTSDRQRVSLLAGRAHRSPGLGELFLENQPVILGNPALETTSLETIELGWRLATPRALVAASAFRNEIDDAIVSVPTTADPSVARFENAGTQETTGIELEATLRLDERTRVRAGATRLFENETNLAATTSPSPEQFFADAFGYLVLLRRFDAADVGLGLRWHGEIEAIGESSDLVVDGRAAFSLGESTRLWLRVVDALDHGHVAPASGAGLGVDGSGAVRREIPLRGREWSVGLERRF